MKLDILRHDAVIICTLLGARMTQVREVLASSENPQTPEQQATRQSNLNYLNDLNVIHSRIQDQLDA